MRWYTSFKKWDNFLYINGHHKDKYQTCTNLKPLGITLLVHVQCTYAFYCTQLTLFFRDLSFRKGDIIILKKQVDDNWYHGEFNSQHGFFPATYVQVVEIFVSEINRQKNCIGNIVCVFK
jgi:hypothetical protein